MQFSDEGANFEPRASQDDISNCFRLVLGRLPSRREWTGHSARIGERLEDVVATYLNSLEFFNRGLMHPVANPVSLVSLDGFVLYASPDDTAVGKHIISSRDYEPNVSRVFRQTVRPGMNVLDVGANIGFYTMLSASLVGPSGKVWAVEPNTDNARFVLASLAQNGFNNVKVIQAAAGDDWETMCLFRDASNAMVAAISATDPSQFPTTVLSLPLDAYLKDKRVSVMKIDVEGAEGAALRGMSQALRRDRPVIFLEFTPRLLERMSRMNGEQFLEMLIDLGYEISVLLDNPVECGCEIARVMAIFEGSGLAHVDLMARPVNAAKC